MLSIFPSLLTYGIVAPFILRMTVGLFFLDRGYRHLKEEKAGVVADMTKRLHAFAKPFVVLVALVEVAIGLSLIAGFLTQIAAIFGIIYMFKMLYFKVECPHFAKHQRLVYILFIVILFSLLITGPGIIAVDLPL